MPEWHHSHSDPSQTASSQLQKQSLVNRNKPRMCAITLHTCHLQRSTYLWGAQSNHRWNRALIYTDKFPGFDPNHCWNKWTMRYDVTFSHRNKKHQPSNASQPTLHAHLEIDARRRWVYASAMAPLFIHAGQHAALFIHLRDTSHMMLPHLDESASDKQVNANSSGRQCLTTSATFPLFPLLIFRRSHVWHMEMWELSYTLLYITTLAALAWTLIALQQMQ